MNVCQTIRKYEGTKSQKILEMIAEKRRKNVEKKIPILIKDKQLLMLLNEKESLNKRSEINKKRLEKRARKLNLKYDSYYKPPFKPLDFCDCETLTKELLQDTQDLYSLGKIKEAQKIWDKIIKEYNLAGQSKNDSI